MPQNCTLQNSVPKRSTVQVETIDRYSKLTGYSYVYTVAFELRHVMKAVYLPTQEQWDEVFVDGRSTDSLLMIDLLFS